jgi:chemotaxis methyl-accepting protein methylase
VSRGDALEDVVHRVSELLERQIGLRTEPTVRGRLRRGVRDEAADQGLDLGRYLPAVAAGGPAMQSLLNRITVQETSFFRHPEHFDVLAGVVLPALVPPVRIWSAGCANGQEAFSLAMVLEEQGIDGEVIATDLSTDALQRTAAASYTAREVTGLSPARLARHLTRTDTGWRIDKRLRARVTTLRHNLIEAVPEQARSCQVVFCRNVLIYVSPEHAKAFLDRLAETVHPVALFLGSAETIWSVSNRFDAVWEGETFIYRPRPLAGSGYDGPTAAGRGSPQRRREPRRVPIATPRTRVRRTPAGPAAPPVPRDDSAAATLLARAGEQALTAGDHRSAVVSFRKWAYLAPDDTLAHLHLGLALEAAGDQTSARRAFEAARRAMTEGDPAGVENPIEGYAAAELLRLLDAKRRVPGA